MQLLVVERQVKFLGSQVHNAAHHTAGDWLLCMLVPHPATPDYLVGVVVQDDGDVPPPSVGHLHGQLALCDVLEERRLN